MVLNDLGSREAVVEYMAQVSHATYLLQAVRDQNKCLAAIEPPPSQTFVETPQRLEDLATTRQWLQAVVGEGRRLQEFSDKPGHLPTCHDRERAKNAVTALERLGLLRFD